ncbi:MAG TPA: CoA protein activase, partial [Thermoanaerobacterales bacterium]|nr:CoA protein activase [Thermoanaerobacterales bacterium]
MKITFPHLGNLHIVLTSFFETLGFDVIVPPPITKKTLELGSLHSPEFACLPLKINIGNFIEALDKGANTIIMAGGIGPCRFGCYAQVQKEILEDLGYEFEMIILDPPKGNMKELLNEINKIFCGKKLKEIVYSGRIAWHKAKAIESIESQALYYRAREKSKGATTKSYKKALKLISESFDIRTINNNMKKICDYFKSIELAITNPLKIALVGEIYTLLEPGSNMNVENILGDLGVEVIKSIKLTEWANTNIILDMFRIKRP